MAGGVSRSAPRYCVCARGHPAAGALWLELSIRADGDDRSCYRQRVIFQPYGLAGEAFWKTSALFRGAVFGGLARDITAKAVGAEVSTRT